MTTNGLINWFDTADSYGTGTVTTQENFMLVFIQLIYRARAGLLSGRSESLLGQFEAGSVESKRKKEVYFCTKLAPFPWRIGSIYNCYLLHPLWCVNLVEIVI